MNTMNTMNTMNILNIFNKNDEIILKKISTDIDLSNEDNDIIFTLKEMYEYIKTPESKGLGLALPQVGINKNGFVAYNKIGTIDGIFINPEIKKEKGDIKTGESCLSVPDKKYQVKRSRKIWVKYLDENNKVQKRMYDGLDAVIFQHEYDHILGKVLTDYGTEMLD